MRTGHFSTGIASEKIIEWREGRSLGFLVLSQPPAMKEMSFHKRVHAPHVDGYFQTGETRFVLEEASEGATRLTIIAAHRLKIEPVFYWEPIARAAISDNMQRVLRDLRTKAERS